MHRCRQVGRHCGPYQNIRQNPGIYSLEKSKKYFCQGASDFLLTSTYKLPELQCNFRSGQDVPRPAIRNVLLAAKEMKKSWILTRQICCIILKRNDKFLVCLGIASNILRLVF